MENFKGTTGNFIIFGNDETMISALPHKIIYNGFNYNLEYEEAKANAKLFAASKDLLQALYEINGLCADAARKENQKLDLDLIAKISKKAIDRAI